MEQGITENQNILELTLKLKDNIKPQITEVTFTNLRSSEGEVSVDEDDRKAIIEIYEEPENPEPSEEPDNPNTPETPVDPENPNTPETPVDPENPNTSETPETPVEPEKPNTPEIPETPVDSEKPNTPETPETPLEPEKPNMPETPETPVDPEKPNMQENPEIPAELEKPVEQEKTNMSEIPVVLENSNTQKDPEISAVTENLNMPQEPEEPKFDSIFSIKTGDSILFFSKILVIFTILLNVFVVLKNKDFRENEELNNCLKVTRRKKSIKSGIIFVISVIVIGLVMLGVTSFAHSSEITDLIDKLDYKEQWLNSEKYLVTDESISRIAPLTDIQDITDKFNKEIEIYEKNSNEKVIDGLVKSGMVISDQDNAYDVSVLGDINGDGESDHIDLTNTIRNIVDYEKYEFNNIEKLSADMNIDKVINQEDVNIFIKYILYEELDIPEFNHVKEPKIEVVGGTFFDKIDAYEDTIQVKITEQDENVTKTKYKIEGTEDKKYTEIESGKIIELPNNGVYKISAYSYGESGNRSEIPYEIMVKRNPNNKYKIIIRTEKEDGTYEETVEEKEGRIGNTVTIDNEIPDGYEIDEAESTLTGEILEDDILELIVTYDKIIDPSTPITKPTIEHTPTEWTNQDVTVTIISPEPKYSIEYRINEDKDWKEYKDKFTISENCEIHARLVRKTNKSEEVDHDIDNIDKISPKFENKTISAVKEEKNDQSIIKIEATDKLSGIVEYGIIKEGYAEPQKYTCESTLDTKLTFSEIYENGTYKMYLKDLAGNISEDTVEITNIKGFNVAKIVEAPEGFEYLIGEEYETLELALKASDSAAQIGNVKIEIIHNIYNEANTIQSGRDYTINLNSYYVKNQEAKPTFTVDGDLRIVDKNKLKKGTVASPFGIGIYISKEGELTLGEDDEGSPSIFSPIVEGLTYGIQKEIDYNAEKVYDELTEQYYFPEGVFNFYDGKIIGGEGAFLAQRINDTPTLYDPTVITNEETKKEESTLAIVSGIEAVIGKKRYMLLEDAIEDANNVIGDSNTQVEISIEKDLAKDTEHKVVVDNTKNIKLDLNGHTFTTTANDYVLENYGKLEIYDSSASNVDYLYSIKASSANIIIGKSSGTNITYSKDVNFEFTIEEEEKYELYIEGEYMNRFCNVYLDEENIYNLVNHSSTSEATIQLDKLSPGKHKIRLYSGQNYGPDYYTFSIRTSKKGVGIITGSTNTAILNGISSETTQEVDLTKSNVEGELTISSGIYECTKQGTSSVDGYTSAIQNEGKLYINGGSIKATKDYSAGIYNGKSNTLAYVEMNGGKIDTYYHSVLNKGQSKIKEGNLYSSNYACVWSDGILNVLGNDVNISGYTGVSTNNSGNTIIDAGTIYGKNYGLYNDSDNSKITINGGNVSAGSYAIYNYKLGTINIENVIITSASYGVFNNGKGTIKINNIEITSVNSSGVPNVSYGLNNENDGKIIFNNGNIYVKNYSLRNYKSGTIEINGGKLKTYSEDYSTVINSNSGSSSKGIIVMAGGTITGPSNAIYNQNKGNVTITGGILETTSENTALANSGDKDSKITLGLKDDNISTEYPIIKSAGSKAVTNELGTFNFYDGKLIGKENSVIYGMVTEIPEQSELVKEIKEDELQYVTLGIPTYFVAKISESENPDVSMLDQSYYKKENGYYHFITLDSAIKACRKTNKSTIELIDSPWVYRAITIDENQEITIKFNEKTMYLFNQLNFENKGNINFINENVQNVSEEEIKYGNISANGGLLLKNNENAQMSLDNISISYLSSVGTSSNLRKLIENYGILNIKNSKYYAYSNSKYMYVYDIYNEQSGTLNIDNINISGNGYYPIVNLGKDKIEGENTTYSAVIKNSNISYNGNVYGVLNNQDGTMIIENSTISSYYESHNDSSGKMIIRNSTISISSYSLKNVSTGFIEIDNSTITCQTSNQSSGKILIKGEKSNLKSINNSKVDGTVEMQAGKVNNNGTGIDNYGKLIISGGEVIGQSNNSTYGIQNRSNGVVTIKGEETKITGSGYGIYNQGTVTVESGIIKGNGNSGIYSTNLLTLGIKDGAINYNVLVYGKTNGVYNTGTFNFYDGILEGNVKESITGKIPSETEEDCIRVIHKGECEFDDKTENKYNVGSGREISTLEQVNVAYVESNQKNYGSLEKALADTQETDTIKIIHDVSINGIVPSLEIANGKNITLDLNGYNIVAGNNKTIVNNGTLKITDSKSHTDEGGNLIEGTFVNGGNIILENNGEATIEHGSYELTIGGSSSDYYSIFTNTGSLEISTNGTFKTNGTYSRVLYNTTGSATIKNGILESIQNYSSAIWNETGTVTIEAGTINGNEHSVFNTGNGKININNGTINNNVYNKLDGTIDISGGNINNYLYNAGTGTINISGGIINYTNTDSAVQNNSSGTINITGGTIKGSNTGIKNNSTGQVNIDGTNLSEQNRIEIIGKNRTDSDSYGINNASTGIINIKGYVSITSSTGSSRNANGINNASTGTINIGDSENITNNVKIESSKYGLSNYTGKHGTINYYGGIIKAPTAVNGYIDKIPEKYDIVKIIDDLNNQVYQIGKMEDVVSVGETKYNTLEDAISSNNSGTITLLKDIVIATSEIQTISDGKNLDLDLNGHSIELHIWNTFLTNYGGLKILDSSELKEGKIYGFGKTTIRNEGNFEMKEGAITIEHNYGDEIIYNTGNGQVKVSGGKLCTISHIEASLAYIIYSDNASTITVTGGTFDFYGIHYYTWQSQYIYGIYTKNPGTVVEISGGIFNSAKKSSRAQSYESAPSTYCIYMSEGGTVNLSGNMVSNNSYGVYMKKSGAVNIDENVNLNNSSYSIYVNNSEVNISIDGGTTKNIQGTSSSTVSLKGGSVIGTVSSCGMVDVYEEVNFNVSGTAISSCINVNIHEGATVTATEKAIYSYNKMEVNIERGIINGDVEIRNGILNMSSGSITGKNYGIRMENSSQSVTTNITGGTITATAGPGILIASGTLNLGENDGGYPDIEVPSITGSTYGVKNDGGQFNFYDGILTGSIYATSGTVTKIPEMFKIIYSNNGTVAVLGIEATFEQVATVNNVFYNDLESAIKSAVNLDGTVKICKDITTASEITIPEGKSVTIDLNGYSINGYTESKALFTNNGTLKIDDYTNEGQNQSTIRNYTGIAIENNGTLIIGTDNDKVYTNTPKIIGKTTAIDNNGQLEFFDGEIGITEEGTIVTGDTDILVPKGYIISKSNNNYILLENIESLSN